MWGFPRLVNEGDRNGSVDVDYQVSFEIGNVRNPLYIRFLVLVKRVLEFLPIVVVDNVIPSNWQRLHSVVG